MQSSNGDHFITDNINTRLGHNHIRGRVTDITVSDRNRVNLSGQAESNKFLLAH